MHFLHTRRREAEWIDEPGADPVLLRESLAYIRRVNRVMGYTRVVLNQLDRFSARWDKSKEVSLLDIGTGSADIPLAILRWADRRGFKVRIVAIDLNPQIVREAAAAVRDPRLTILRADALRLPFSDGAFDYTLTSMFLHHLDDADAQQALSEMGRVAKRGIVASDLLRHRSAYAFIWLFTLLSNPMVKHDARVSIAQSFNREEILGLRDGAGVGFADYSVHFMHRFVLAGEKSGQL
jgi:ubiquinone/menaquinone biosynthesis C-methylase UbiE